MPEKSGFFDSTGSDVRSYPARDFADYFAQILTSGVFNGGQYLNPTVTGTDATVSLSPGYAWIKGYVYSVYATPLPLLVQPAAALPRVDRLILRLDTSLATRSIQARIIQGTPSSNPNPPALTRSGDVYDLSIAQIRVNANTTIITQANITDERLNSTVCGLVNSLVQVDTTVFQQQWDAFIKSIQNDGFATTQYVDTAITNTKAYVDARPWQKTRITSDTGFAIDISNGNLNDVRPSGWYMGTNVANAPGTGWIYYEIIRHNDAYELQNAYDFYTNTYQQRRKQGGTWGPWSADVFQSGVDAKQGIVNAINAKGGSASMNDDWATLAAKINAINTGKRFATGQFMINSSGQGSVSGLAFTPRNITINDAVYPTGVGSTYFGAYSADAYTLKDGVQVPLNEIRGKNNGSTVSDAISVTSNGFSINAPIVNNNRTYNFFATE